ncbi:MAG: hypothetical protein ISEC1_P1137 [Thiomicrorhabdus sp.]|nr:MAG: hypothetical protein ISEC1_P1137 [Thiomicrorhabdus sp.]
MKPPNKKSIKNLAQFFVLLSLVPATLLLTGCGKTETELCIDKQTHLWDNVKGRTKEDNKTYWNAVENCRKKFK